MATNKEIVDWIKADDPRGAEALWLQFERPARYYIHKRIGPRDAEDVLHDVYIELLIGLRKINDPEFLPGFTITILKRVISKHIGRLVDTREHIDADGQDQWMRQPDHSANNPEHAAMCLEESAVAAQALGGLKPREQQILVRFYLMEEPLAELRASFGMTNRQFCQLKSRTKCKLGQRGQELLKPKYPKAA